MKLLIFFVLLSIYENTLIVGETSIIGVPPNEQGHYNPTINQETGEKTWHCLGDPGIILSYDQINDNYCDCPDGSDEPGTNACPYEPKRKFYCHNEGHVSGYLENFKLNDGVCDYEICCDGSDEYLTGKCENKCSEIHQQFLIYMQAASEEIETSLSSKRNLISIAREKRSMAEDRVNTLKRELELNIESKNNGEQQSPDDETVEQLVYSKLSPYFQDLEKAIQFEKIKIEDHSKKIGHLESILSNLIDNYNPNFNDLAVKDTVNKFRDYVSNKDEQSENEENSLHLLNNLLKESEKHTCDSKIESNDDVPYDYPNFLNMIHYYYSSFVKSYMKSQEVDVPPSEEKNPFIQDEGKDIELLRDQIVKINKDLENDYGEDDILRSVQSQWVKKRMGGYTYNIGFLDSIYQDSILIGRYFKREGNKLIYNQGAKCWNGPRRSGIIEMICGPKNDLISIGEPEKCEYHLELTTPIACNEVSEEELLSKFKINYEIL